MYFVSLKIKFFKKNRLMYKANGKWCVLLLSQYLPPLVAVKKATGKEAGGTYRMPSH